MTIICYRCPDQSISGKPSLWHQVLVLRVEFAGSLPMLKQFPSFLYTYSLPSSSNAYHFRGISQNRMS